MPYHAVAQGALPVDSQQVVIEFSGCAELDQQEVRRIVAIELRSAGMVPAVADGIRGRVQCDGLRATLRVEDTASAKAIERELDLSTIARVAHERSIALTVAELVSARASEGSRDLVAAAPPPTVDAKPNIPSVDEPAPYRVVGSGLLRGQFDRTLSYGVSARLGVDVLPWLVGTVEAAYSRSRVVRTLGFIDVDDFDASALLWLQRRGTLLSFSSGVGGRVGVLAFRGEPRDSMQASSQLVRGLFAGPVAQSSLVLDLSAHFLLELTVEIGWAAVAARAKVESAPSIQVGPLFYGGTLGAGTRF